MRSSGEATATREGRAPDTARALLSRLPEVLSLARFSLLQRFALFSLVILVVGAYIIGSYVSREISDRVISRTSALTALYVDSFVSPYLQELRTGHDISDQDAARLDQLLAESSLGEKIVSFKVWHRDGDIVWSRDETLIGQRFPITDDLAVALGGGIHTEMSDLSDAENARERIAWNELLETYTPLRANSTGEVIGVVEFYQHPGDLNAEIASSQRNGWFIVGGSTAIMYLLLVGMVAGASSTISRQHGNLQHFAEQNASLAEHVRLAAMRKSETDELLLKRVAQDLHDGPAQDVSMALLRLDSLARSPVTTASPVPNVDLMRTALASALTEIRQICAGLRLPEMEALALGDVIRKAVNEHEQKTGDTVSLSICAGLPEVGLATKIALYRVTQEALNNAHLHAAVKEERAEVRITDGWLHLEIVDKGDGTVTQEKPLTGRQIPGAPLGIRGMTERIEMLGGTLQVTTTAGKGTTVRASLPLTSPVTRDE
jgi:signal transduction histidine kinase